MSDSFIFPFDQAAAPYVFDFFNNMRGTVTFELVTGHFSNDWRGRRTRDALNTLYFTIHPNQWEYNGKSPSYMSVCFINELLERLENALACDPAVHVCYEKIKTIQRKFKEAERRNFDLPPVNVNAQPTLVFPHSQVPPPPPPSPVLNRERNHPIIYRQRNYKPTRIQYITVIDADEEGGESRNRTFSVREEPGYFLRAHRKVCEVTPKVTRRRKFTWKKKLR